MTHAYSIIGNYGKYTKATSLKKISNFENKDIVELLSADNQSNSAIEESNINFKALTSDISPFLLCRCLKHKLH